MKNSIKKYLSLLGAVLFSAENVPALPNSQTTDVADNTLLPSQNSHPSNRYSPDGIELELAISKMEFSPAMRQKVEALSLLAKDIISNPTVAASFSANPQAYLDNMGFKGVTLNINAAEVKVVMALADPTVRDAVKNNDFDAFLSELAKRGLLKSPEITALSEKGSFVRCSAAAAVCVAYVIAVAASQAAVAYNVVATVNAVYKVTVATSVAVKTTGVSSDTDDTGKYRIPMSTIAQALGGQQFASNTMEYYVDTYVEKIALAIEANISPEQLGKLTGPRLRAILAEQICLQLNVL